VIIDGLVRATAAPRRRIRGISIAATVIFLAAAIGACIWLQSCDSEQPSNLRIAVLPFSSDARDPARRYFADGIAEDVTTELSRIVGVAIAGQSVAVKLKEAGAARREAATALGVDRLLEGSVRQAGDHVRITVKLTNAHTDVQIWTERFDREFQDVFAVQDEIADLVAREVASVISGAASLTPPVHTPNVDAYDAYVFGRARRIPPMPKNLA
jgi:adenylate cyclase